MEHLDKMRQHAKVVMWTFDWMLPKIRWEPFMKFLPHFDALFTTMGSAVNWREVTKIPVYTLRQGIDPKFHYTQQHPKTVDVGFIGNLSRDSRKKWLQTIERGIGKKIRVFSSSFGKKLVSVIGHSKIIIGDAYPGSEDKGYWSNRVYVMLGCGAFFICRHIKGIEEEFENFRHLVWAKNDAEMINLIKIYLKDEKSRERIAEAGYRLVREKYQYKDRIAKMLEILK